MKVLAIPLALLLIGGCKTTVHEQRTKHIERCMEVHQNRGESYSDAISDCTESAEKFLGSLK